MMIDEKELRALLASLEKLAALQISGFVANREINLVLKRLMTVLGLDGGDSHGQT